MKSSNRVYLVVALLVVVLLLTLACAPGAATPSATPTLAPRSGWQRVVEAAKKEGRLTIYASTGPAAHQAMTEQFGRQTGLTLEIVNMSPATTQERIRLEQQSGAHVSDLILSAITTVADHARLGFGQPVPAELPSATDKAIFRVDPWAYDVGGHTLLTWQQEATAGILVNTNLVKEGEITSWSDLLDPRWKGKIIILDPRAPVAGAGAQAYAAMELGMDYWKKMAGQGLRFDRDVGRVVQAVSMGEKPVALFARADTAEVAILAGAPIKYIHPKEGSMLVTFAAMTVKNGPHPNATAVFMNWLISKEGHEAVMRALHRAGIRKDLEPTWLKIPEFRPDAPKKLFSRVATNPTHSQEVVQFMIEALGKP